MDINNRPLAPAPYELLPAVPSFTLTSQTLVDGQVIPTEQVAQGGNVSPALSWSGFPANTASFAVSCFDPDAPTPSGYWHWIIVDIPPTSTALPLGAGTSDLELDGCSFHLRNDAGSHAYYGPNPPQGDRPHRYIFAVHALDIDTLEASDDDSAANAACNMIFHTIARATLTVTFQQ